MTIKIWTRNAHPIRACVLKALSPAGNTIWKVVEVELRWRSPVGIWGQVFDAYTLPLLSALAARRGDA